MEYWTPQKLETLFDLLDGKRSASQIGAEIGVSRNAIIGKINRLRAAGKMPPGKELRGPCVKLPPKPKAPMVPKKLLVLRNVVAQRFNRPPVTFDVSGVAFTERFKEGFLGQIGKISFDEINGGKCRFPIDQETGGPVRYCGNQSEQNGVYCPHHAARCYRVMP